MHTMGLSIPSRGAREMKKILFIIDHYSISPRIVKTAMMMK